MFRNVIDITLALLKKISEDVVHYFFSLIQVKHSKFALIKNQLINKA